MPDRYVDRAAREFSRVALVTCAEFPELEADDRLLVEPLNRLGVTAEPAVWDDPAVDWAGYDLAVLRSSWDYPPRRDEFVAWARAVPRLANPAPVVAWNTDKRYLAELARAGVPVVPTTWLAPGDGWTPHPTGEMPHPTGETPHPTGETPHPTGEYVIKPAVGAGSLDTGRYDLTDPVHRRLAADHVARLHAAGRTVMVQPYLPAVDAYGETALLFFRGEFSHAVRKGPMLTGPDVDFDGLYRPEDITPREPTPAERAVAERVLAAAPGGLLYARVDLIPGPDGAPLLVELELTEPSLFLAHAPGAADRLASAIAAGTRTRRAD